MTTERLIFEALSAAKDAELEAGILWRTERMDRDQCERLSRAALRLSCAAQELENRAAGKPPPQRG